MANYIIIGGDSKEYGPIPAGDVRQWIAEGRLNEQSLVKGEGDAEFRTLDKFPEFADAFAPPTAAPGLPPLPGMAAGSAGLSDGDYDLDITGCFGRGWNLVKENMGLLFVGTLIYLLIEMAVGALANIPLIGAIFSIANFIISGPLLAGVFYLFIRTLRGEPAEVGDIFSGFRRGFGQLFLGTLVPALFILLCMLPFLIVLGIKCVPLIGHLEQMQRGTPPDHATMEALQSALLVSLPVLFVCAIPAIYLSVSWKFTLPLIIDRELDFWTAMKTSRRQVGRHWWHVFGLVVLTGLLNTLGIFLCCVGLLFTIPIGFAALMFAYEAIFSERPAA
jgi:uncharacterized membrane protein